ncbi:response regulator [Bradyrhizobium manausense]|uniref:response regulator n=1 Tax=Bradyrhizobium manausense TaxID=989370 RepID=UPI001BA9B451|nr:response regulator [Bradyrhizobium manausense]MBR0827324.1 response regulator [Bradyrhizobium manausense]
MSDLDPGTASQSGRRAPKRKVNGTDEPDSRQELLLALQAMRSGDFSVRMSGEYLGIDGKIADTLNEIIAANQRMAQQLELVGEVVGREGRTKQRVRFGLASGSWADMEGSVNTLIDDLLWPTREVTRAVAAVAQGDLLQTVKLDVDGRPLRGEFLQSATIVNTMIKQLGVFTSEVTRVAREVGTEGKLGGQAQVPEVTGVWKDLTESVNSMANNLTNQVRNIAEVTIAVANGDLSKKITVDVRGEILQLKEAINTMVDQLRSFASEVTRVAREVGTDGKLGGQAIVPGVAGTWKDLTDSVNAMCGNLTAQVRNIANVTTAVARGDLSRKITVDVRGEILELKDTINTMVDQLNSFASEVTRVAREVGTEGKLGGQAQVPGVAGTWKDLTDNVNFMASNLTAQVRNIADVATAIASGDLSKKITVNVSGEILQLKETLNTMVDQLNAFAGEVTRVAREVGTDGRLGGQANVLGVAGTWKDLTESVNSMASNLTAQVRNIAEVTTAVAGGDLSKKITVDVRGEILELKNTINTMVDQLNAFAGEVTRVAREVGTEGKLGGQAQVPGVAGTWKDLTDTVNFMAANLTEQVRGIVKVVTAVANGDLKQNLTVKSKGEVAALADTINNMTETLATFAEQVTSVAREVGVEGRLGGQANVPGAAGTWKDLTGNVNLLAANLTSQVRAIAEVATAVTKGDLTRSIQVDARGEVAELKDNINTMITNLRLTTDVNTEQDWLKTNLAKFTNMLQGQRDLTTVGRLLLSELSPLVNAHTGVIYQVENEDNPHLLLLASYAGDGVYPYRRMLEFGEGLIGQCALDKRPRVVAEIPTDVVPINSAMFRVVPKNLVVLPVLFENQVKAVIELASLTSFTTSQMTFLEQLTDSIGIVLNSIEATMQTEGLLKQSQQLAGELQTQQRELQQTNDQLEQKAQQLAERNVEVERKNQEIEQARRALEEKATELALTSKYKSEFLANMSHELRTPLNSILILGQQLTDNPDGNLSAKQVEFARTIHGAGTDLLNLISDILDLSKIESGTVTVDAEEILTSNLLETVGRPFRHEAENRNLSFNIDVDPNLARSIVTDSKRLQQVLKNLLSNAFKFTAEGGVKLKVEAALGGWSPDHPVLNSAPAVIAFEVSDTGIGIPLEKQKLIFEAFQQADAGTSRKYGGTGLGLAISRELASLLGGEIHLRSSPGKGSAFTLYLPLKYSGPTLAPRTPAPTPGQPPALQAQAATPERVIEQLPDDRLDLEPGDTILLIVEDDPHYARILIDLARDKGFKVLVAARGAEALELAKQYQPSAVSLDVFLPDMLGWTVLSQLKHNPLTRHIPVQIITLDEDRQHALARGAFSFVNKPTTTEGVSAALSQIKEYARPRRKRLLIVEDNEAEQLSIRELLHHDDIEIVATDTGAGALTTLREAPCDCVVLDLRLPDMTGFEVLDEIRNDELLSNIPVVVFTGRELSAEEDAELHTMARSIVVKGVESPERLLDETALFLHRVITELPVEKQRMLEKLNSSDEDLIGKTALLVDDDARNIFALSSVLERRGMKVLTATTGSEAVTLVESNPEIAIVLMDIMMPQMDGYQTIGVIRQDPAFARLPIIALTAKAMKGDREKCLEAGASDYLAKPVNTDQLLLAIRMWLHR